jgi:hypothetical protein
MGLALGLGDGVEVVLVYVGLGEPPVGELTGLGVVTFCEVGGALGDFVTPGELRVDVIIGATMLQDS